MAGVGIRLLGSQWLDSGVQSKARVEGKNGSIHPGVSSVHPEHAGYLSANALS